MQVKLRRRRSLKNVPGPSYLVVRPVYNENEVVCFEGRLIFDDAVLWNADTIQTGANGAYAANYDRTF